LFVFTGSKKTKNKKQKKKVVIRIALIGFGFFGGNFQLSLSSATITIASPDLHGPSCLLPETHPLMVYYKYIKTIFYFLYDYIKII